MPTGIPTEVRFNPGVEASVSTRSIVSGTGFPNYYTNPVDVRGSYAIFICRHETGAPTEFQNSMASSNNIRAMAAVSGEAPATITQWHYSYSSSLNASFDNAYINDGEHTADFYAYAPWVAGVSRPDQIPYSFAQQYDLMYATQNNTTDNRDVAADGIKKEVSFTFRHALACLRFQLKKKYQMNGDNIVLMYAELHKTTSADADTHLYSQGTFNAMNGEFSNLTNASTLRHDFADFALTDNISTYVGFETLVVPTNINDGGIEVQFYFNNNTTAETLKFPIKREYTNDGTGHYGFQAGKIYTFQITVDNYLKLDGIKVSDQWIEEAEKTVTI
jgi:hypothetical protein